jgi:site-specific DNA-cytosine methylase
MNKLKPKVLGGIGEKKSNGGTQWYQQDRIYDNEIAISVTTAFNPYYIVPNKTGGNMLKGGKQLTETIEKNIDKFEKGKVLDLDLYNRTVNEELSQTLTDPTHNKQRLFDGFRIRKLTPKECWRLMGFDDSDFERAAKVNSNTQLYKQAGNSIVVNVLEAILTNLLLETKQDIPKGQTTIFDYGV